MEFKQSELPFIKELLREHKSFDEFSKLDQASDISRCIEHSSLNIYTVTLPRLKDEQSGVFNDVTDRFQEPPSAGANKVVESRTFKKGKLPNQFLIPEVEVVNDHRHESERVQKSTSKLQWDIEVLCSKRKHAELAQSTNHKKVIHKYDEGTKKSRKKRMDEWSSDEVIMLLQCTKLLINCELKCISRALFPFIRRSPGKCWGRAAEKKLKRMNIFGNWRQSNKVDVLGRINKKLQELGNPPISKELVLVTDQIKMQVETSSFQESSTKFQQCGIDQISVDY